MKQNIIGREKEKAILERILQSDKPEFVAVCGRRRVGKIRKLPHKGKQYGQPHHQRNAQARAQPAPNHNQFPGKQRKSNDHPAMDVQQKISNGQHSDLFLERMGIGQA